MKQYDYDVALIMKKIFYQDGTVGFIPDKVVEGYYVDDEGCFIDFDGTPYFHIIDEPESYGFCFRLEYNNIKKQCPLSSSKHIKSTLLKEYKEDLYYYFNDSEVTEHTFDAPVIIYGKSKDDYEVLRDDVDLANFYYNNYPEFYNTLYADYLGKEVEDIAPNKDAIKEKNISVEDNKFDIKSIYDKITSSVIDQDEPIMKILIAIRKQINNFSESQSRNILINGGTGVGKTEIFRILTKLVDVPCVITSATQYSGTGYVGGNVEDMLVSLVKRAKGDVEKAQRGILIIDEVDKLSETNSGHSQVNQKDVQEALLKILEDGVLSINVDNKTVEFDTSKLMVIAMGSWSRVEIEPEKSIGFGSKVIEKKKSYKELTREDMVNNGLSKDFVGRFKIIVQMNDLNLDSFKKILKTENGIVNKNKKYFLDEEGVELIIKENAYNAIAKKAENSMFGARDLDSIVETALSVASFEIASNPNKYSELIIDENTIEDNKKYTLVKRLEKRE